MGTGPIYNIFKVRARLTSRHEMGRYDVWCLMMLKVWGRKTRLGAWGVTSLRIHDVLGSLSEGTCK